MSVNSPQLSKLSFDKRSGRGATYAQRR